MKKKLPTSPVVTNLLQDLILGPKFLTKKRKEEIQKLLKNIDGLSCGNKHFDIVFIIGDTILDFPVSIGEPRIRVEKLVEDEDD
jgi:hypothetical protein